jgi:two-component system chemotaxis sensor kinase CheA
MDELLEQFIIEGRELVEQASSDLLALERAPTDSARLDRVFRAVHTLKGSVALFDFAPMGRMLHVAEDLLGDLRKNRADLTAAMADALLQCVDITERWIEAIAQAGVLPTGAEREAQLVTEHLLAASRVKSAPDPQSWVDDLLVYAREVLVETGYSDRSVVAVRYEPRHDSLLKGDDPLLLVRAIPELLTLRISAREQWKEQDFNPYRCNLRIDVLSGASVEKVRDVFRRVDGQVAIVEAAPIAGLNVETSGTVPDGSARGVRIDAARIDALVSLAGELIVAKNTLGHLVERIAATGSSASHPLAANLAGFERLTAELHRTVMRMRMIPLARTFTRFPRWMRETAGKLGKVVTFDVIDNGAEADRAIVDGLFEPLLHVLRNALDHGIEDAASRHAAGKPAAGRIALEARPRGDKIAIVVRDDGAGLDLPRIRELARSKGLVTAEALDALDDAGAADLIFLPGFSTAKEVTDISGRGVGMDAVRAAVMALGGRVSIASGAGTGTAVEMLLPQAVLLSTVVTVAVGSEHFGVPIDTVAETCRVPHNLILPVRSGEAFVLRRRTLPLLRLSDLLRLPKTQREEETKVLVINAGKDRIGIEVDHVGERLDVVMWPMTGLLSGMPGVLGTSLLGDGSVLLILDLPELAS